MAKLKKKDNQSCQGFRESGTLSLLVQINNDTALLEKSLAVSYKVKHIHSI